MTMVGPYYLTELDNRAPGSWHASVPAAVAEAHRLIDTADVPLFLALMGGVEKVYSVARVDHPYAVHALSVRPVPVPSPLPENYRSTEELDREAHALYDHERPASAFAETFSIPELARLVQLCIIGPDGSGGRGYDDEVYDALHIVLSAQVPA